MDCLPENERELVYPVQLETSMFNGDGAITVPAVQQTVIRAFMAHLSDLDMDAPALIRRFGASWVMLTQSIELLRPVRRNARLQLHTWNAKAKNPIYRREFIVHDENGCEIFQGAATFAIMDLSTRHITANRAVYDYCDRLPAGETLIEAAPRKPELPEVLYAADERIVRPSWIDGLGHMNNVRYGELAYDALTPEARGRMRDLQRVDVWFMHELHEGQRVQLMTDGATAVTGTAEGADAPCFAVKLRFREATL